MTASSSAMISCLMVTAAVPERLAYLRRSVEGYLRQTYAHRELLIVFDRAAEAREGMIAFLTGLRRPDIRVIEVPDRLTLGALRNISRDAASGDIHCQWDDDDLHHPDRLERQFAALAQSGREAVYLQEVMQYFPDRGTLYCTNWRATEAMGHPGTLMCLKECPIRYPEDGEEAVRGEDRAVSLGLCERGQASYLTGSPHLFVYVSHGRNTWPDTHHQMLVDRLGMSRALLLRREAQLRDGLRGVDFGGAPITVQGSNGAAFTLMASA